jgi:NAD(P)-dependent dehydrogenase (short-subunit alcohol dehydrogenase family)
MTTTNRPTSAPAQQLTPPGLIGDLTPTPDHGEESYVGSGRLAGKVALITGGDSGIGRAVAIAYAREGADVLIAYLSEDEDAEDTADWVRKAGRRCVVVRGSVTDEAHCEALVTQAVDELGGLDILVNNAAFQRTYESIDDITLAEWETTFRTNIFAPFMLSKAAVRVMKKGSAIINTTSIQGKDPSPHLLAYASTKGALANFTIGLSQMLGEKGIRVNAVAPGPIWTPLIPSTMAEDKVEKFGTDTPLGRMGQPAELAGAYVLLASELGSYMTGSIVAVTGGEPML